MLLLLFFSFLFSFSAPNRIFLELQPSIDFTNIELSVLPTLTFYFSSNAELSNYDSYDMTIRIGLPWRAIEPEVVQVSRITDTQTLSVNPWVSGTPVEHETVSGYTYIFIGMGGLTYEPDQIYGVSVELENWPEKTGHQGPMTLELCSAMEDDFIVFASSYSFLPIYAASAPLGQFTVKDKTVDSDKTKPLSEIIAKIEIEPFEDGARRILIKLKGYSLPSTSYETCDSEAERTSGASEIPVGYECTQDGDDLTYHLDDELPAGKYKLLFKAITGPYENVQFDVEVYTMEEIAPIVIEEGVTDGEWSTTATQGWSTKYPKLFISNEYDVSSSSLPDGIGFFSTEGNPSLLMNHVTFEVKTSNEFIGTSSADYYGLQIHLGTTRVAVPLNYIWDTFPTSSGCTKSYSVDGEYLLFSGISVNSETIYKLSFHVAFLKAEELDSLFLTVNLLYLDEDIILSGQPSISSEFFTTIFSPQFVNYFSAFYPSLPETGYFQSLITQESSFLSTISSYSYSTTVMGLRAMDDATLWFGSHIGPNKYYGWNSLTDGTVTTTNYCLVELILPGSGFSSSQEADYSLECDVAPYESASTGRKWLTTDLDATDISAIWGNSALSIQNSVGLRGCDWVLTDIGGKKLIKIRWFLDDFEFSDATGNVAKSLIDYVFPTDIAGTSALDDPTIFTASSVDYSGLSYLPIGDTDAILLDAFLRVIFNTGTSSMVATLNSVTPDIVIMENMVVFTEYSTSEKTLADTVLFIEDFFGYADHSLGTGYYAHEENIPPILHISGNLGSVSSSTKCIRIFFQMMKPIFIDETTKEFSYGYQNIDIDVIDWNQGLNDFIDVGALQEAGVKGYSDEGSYSFYTFNILYASSLDIWLNTVPGSSQDISIALPIQPDCGDEYLSSSALETSFPEALISVMALGSDGEILAHVGRGTNNGDFEADELIRQKSSSPYNEFTSADTQSYYSSISNLDDYSSIVVSGNEGQVGSFESLTYYAEAPSTGLASLLCGDWNFMAASDFSVVQSSSLNTDELCIAQLEVYGYYCVFCPNLRTTTDNQATFESFELPAENGLEPPIGFMSSVNAYGSSNIYVTELEYGDLQLEMGESSFLDLSVIQFTESSEDVYLPLSFNITNGIPSGGAIELTPVTGQNYLDSTEYYKCYTGSSAKEVVNQYCLAEFSSSSIAIYLSQSVSANSELYVNIYGLYVDSFSVDVQSFFKFQTFRSFDEISSAEAVIDGSSTEESSLLEIDFLTGSSYSLKIISSFTWPAFSAVGTTATLAVTVSYHSRWLRSSYMIIDMGDLNTNSNDFPLNCRVENSKGKIIPYFSACQSFDLSELVLYGQDTSDYNLETTFYIKLDGYNNPSNTPTTLMTISSYFSKTELAVSLSDTGSFSTSFSSYSKYSEVSLIVDHDCSGFRGAYHFTVTTGIDNGILEDAYIFIQFPPGYGSELSSQGFECLNEENTSLSCSLAGTRLIVITKIETQLEKGESFSFSIWGIDTPYTKDTRSVVVFHKNSPELNGYATTLSTISEWGHVELDETCDLSSVHFLKVSDMKLGTNSIRTTTTLSFTLNFESDLSRDRLFIIELNYLKSHENKRITELSCSMIDEENNPETNIAMNCYLLDTRIFFKTGSTASKDADWSIVVEGLSNPDFNRYNQPTIRVVVSDAVETESKTIKHASDILTINSEVYDFVTPGDYPSLSIQKITEEEFTITAIMGFYVQLVIRPSEQAFYDDLTFEIDEENQEDFVSEVYEATMGIKFFGASTGDTFGTIYIGPMLTIAAGNHNIKITQTTSNGATYGQPPIVIFSVSEEKLSLKSSESTYTVASGGYSYPIEISSSELPIDTLTFDITIDSDFGVTAVDDFASFTLGPDQQKFIFWVQHDGKEEDYYQKGSITITPNGNDLFNELVFAFQIEPPISETTLGLTAEVTTIEAFSATITISTYFECTIYYSLGPSTVYTKYDLDTLKGTLQEGITEASGVIYGYEILKSGQISVKISGLASETFYSIIIYAETLSNESNDLEIEFRTTEASSHGEFTITFTNEGSSDSDFNNEDYSTILCRLMRNYGIPKYRLYTNSGHNCDEDLSSYWVTETTVSSGTSSSDSDTSEPVTIIEQALDADLVQMLSDAANQVTASESLRNLESSSSTKSITFLVYGQYYEEDLEDLFTQLQEETSSLGVVLELRTLLADLAYVKSVTKLSEFFLPSTRPQIQNQKALNFTGTTSNITIGPVKMDQVGWIHAMASKQGTFDSVSYSSFQDSESYTSITHVEYTESGSEIYVVLDGVDSSTSYDVYFYGSGEDYREYGTVSELIGTVVQTKAKSTVIFSPVLVLDVLGLLVMIAFVWV